MPSTSARLRPALGTCVQISLSEAGLGLSTEESYAQAFSVFQTVDQLMSAHRKNSELGRLNRLGPGSWMDLHPWTRTVLEQAQELWSESRGCFDIRCGAILSQWKVLGASPSAGEQGSWAGTPALEFRGRRARKTGPWMMDLGGIAKGFAVDQARRVLKRRHSYGCVNAGGDLSTWGHAQTVQLRGPSWTRILPPLTGAVATSTVRRFPGRRRRSWHLRPSTRRPLIGARSATVLAPNCALADALTKVVLAAPPEVADRCLRRRGAKALLFSPDGRLLRALG
ncbi:MAG TPA: FAD:protein FMN transferase [bacterium]|nr:FAD:protein FMN transferase [bacterium]